MKKRLELLVVNVSLILGAIAMVNCASSPAPNGSCNINSDCLAFSNYCNGCACTALGKNQPPPTCDGTQVQCFRDPCQGNEAVCIDGWCAIRQIPAT